jgi:hypothetical protein
VNGEAVARGREAELVLLAWQVGVRQSQTSEKQIHYGKQPQMGSRPAKTNVTSRPKINIRTGSRKVGRSSRSQQEQPYADRDEDVHAWSSPRWLALRTVMIVITQRERGSTRRQMRSDCGVPLASVLPANKRTP